MTPGRSVKAGPARPRLVAVIASVPDLLRARRLRSLPDLFEVRLDALHPLSPGIEQTISKLARPLIITARHRLEGGCNNLSPAQRRQLHLQFMPKAAWVDLELRSVVQLASVLEAARKRGAKRIISVHELRRTPSLSALERLLSRARSFSPDVFKIVTRTDTPEELLRLLNFFETHKKEIPLSAMGIGKLGRESRVTLMQRGSVLNYVHLGAHLVEGQFELRELNQWTGEG